MLLEWFVARRYLSSRRGTRFLSMITLISAGGVFVGVMALILVTSVMNGVQGELRDQLLGGSAHVWVTPRDGEVQIASPEEALATVRQLPGVISAAAFVDAEVGLVTAAQYPEAVALRGIDPFADGPPVTDVVRAIREGTLHLDPTRTNTGLPPLLVGEGLAMRLGLFEGSVVQLLPIRGIRMGPLGPYVPPNRFEVVGEFRTGMFTYDDKLIYTTLAAAQELIGMGAEVTGLEVRVPDPGAAPAVSQSIEARLGPEYMARDWYTMNASLLDALKLEKLAMWIILSLIVLVAALNIIGTLVMLVADKTREIGILKSMGMRTAQVQRVFMLQGVAIGVIGGTLGAAGALTVAWLQNRYGFVGMPEQVYVVDRLPVVVDAAEVALILGASVVISFLATLYPARRASQLVPVDAIRHE